MAWMPRPGLAAYMRQWASALAVAVADADAAAVADAEAAEPVAQVMAQDMSSVVPEEE